MSSPTPKKNEASASATTLQSVTVNGTPLFIHLRRTLVADWGSASA